jgi:hypothetical protein
VVRYDLWPRPYRLPGFASQVMRLSDDLRRCVVFIGTLDNSVPSGIRCFGTGFLVAYKSVPYLVTNQHIASGIGDAPFGIRINKSDGSSDNVRFDPIEDGLEWVCNVDDPNVDLAAMPFQYDLHKAGYNVLYVHDAMLQKMDTLHVNEDISIGDFCYTIGLFHVLAGEQRNLPVVHTGHIALLPSDERIPVRDWLGPPDSIRHVEGYLIESQSLKGLSGSPCFVRGTISFQNLPVRGEKMSALLPRADIRLLGIWQCSWDAPPDEVLMIEQGNSLRVPLGMGVVIPTEKLIDIFELPREQSRREEIYKRREAENAAKPDTSS